MKLSLKFKHECVCTNELISKINYLESHIEKENIDIDEITGSINEEKLYDNIIPEILSVEEKHLYYVKLLNKSLREYAKSKRARRKKKKS